VLQCRGWAVATAGGHTQLTAYSGQVSAALHSFLLTPQPVNTRSLALTAASRLAARVLVEGQYHRYRLTACCGRGCIGKHGQATEAELQATLNNLPIGVCDEGGKEC
jgi:hypothetical protein